MTTHFAASVACADVDGLLVDELHALSKAALEDAYKTYAGDSEVACAEVSFRNRVRARATDLASGRLAGQ